MASPWVFTRFHPNPNTYTLTRLSHQTDLGFNQDSDAEQCILNKDPCAKCQPKLTYDV